MSMANVKKGIIERAKTARPRVKAYVPHLIEKIDTANAAAGSWLEELVSQRERLQPKGLFTGWEKADFAELIRIIGG